MRRTQEKDNAAHDDVACKEEPDTDVKIEEDDSMHVYKQEE